MNMDNIYKLVESKIGKVEVKDIKKTVVSGLALTIGTVCIGTGFFSKANINTNLDTDRTIMKTAEVNDNKFSDALEVMLDEKIDSKYKSTIDNLEQYLDKIDAYNKGNDAEKYDIGQDLVYDRREIEDASLNLLKSVIADENGVSVDDVKIYVGTYGNNATINKNGESKKVNLHKDEGQLSCAIAALQGYDTDGMTNNTEVMDEGVRKMRDVILDCVKLVNGKEDYRVPINVDYQRHL